ncbi:hypothetical protein MUK42_31897 [Musa troglodytarum]|uniref:Uncharacterized protein n=1 Tax=Musa troglodytarum TaxID=320322 RepID=A0A9E7FG00_9LILI|nr:hypothetical protein MUK42_31897 [Musa troglodytarum]
MEWTIKHVDGDMARTSAPQSQPFAPPQDKMEDDDGVHRRKRGADHQVLLPLLTRRAKSGGTEQQEGVGGGAKCFCLVGRLTSRLLCSRPLSSGAVSASAAHVSEEGGGRHGGWSLLVLSLSEPY